MLSDFEACVSLGLPGSRQQARMRYAGGSEDQEEAVGASRPARLSRRRLRQCSSKTLWSDQLQVPRLKVTIPGDPCPTGRGWH